MQLLLLFQNILSDSESQIFNISKELIEYSSQTALQFLNQKYQSDRTKFINLGYTFTDIAIDAITPLFISNQRTGELGIIKSLRDWRSPTETETQAQYFLNKIVVNRVEQEIIRIYREADPFFAKIHDAVEFVIEKNGYCKKTIYGTVYMFESEEVDFSKTITPDRFDNLPYSIFTGKLGAIVKNLFAQLKNEMGYSSAIPMNAFVKRIKHLHLSDNSLNLTTSSEHLEEKIDSKKIIEESLAVTFVKLNSSYHSKLNNNEKDAFRSALIEISHDLADGGLSSGLYEYLDYQMTDLSREEFYKKYHSKMDYLWRILKKEIASRIEFSNSN